MTAKTWRGDLANVLVPVIFSNGRDDDTPGLVAAFENKRVQFRDRVYEPFETIELRDEVLVFSASCFVFQDRSMWPDTPSKQGKKCKVLTPMVGRNVRIMGGNTGFGLIPRP
jgi:hypothetical protein